MSSTDEWIKKLRYIYIMEYYSAIKRNIFESVLMKWMNLQTIIQSEVSHKEKDKYHILIHIYGKELLNEAENRRVKKLAYITQHNKLRSWLWSHHFMANRWGKCGNSDRFFFLGSKITEHSDCNH